MKRTILSILALLFFIANLSAQECKYKEYYRIIDLAGKHFTKQNYKEASTQYKLAFSKTDFPLGYDLDLALFTANETNDNAWAGWIAEKLAKGGVPLRYFGKYKRQKWYEKFKFEFENYSEYYTQNYNLELKQGLISLLQRDREFNNKYHEWRTKEIDLTLNELIDGATTILNDFESIIEKYGFPDEPLMGYNYVRRLNRIETYRIEVLIIHIYQRGVLILKDEIDNVVCVGGLHPKYAETLKRIRGFGNSTGIEQEMKLRYEKYRGIE